VTEPLLTIVGEKVALVLASLLTRERWRRV